MAHNRRATAPVRPRLRRRNARPYRLTPKAVEGLALPRHALTVSRPVCLGTYATVRLRGHAHTVAESNDTPVVRPYTLTQT